VLRLQETGGQIKLRSVTMSQEAYETILTCRSVQHFTGTPIPDNTLTRILQAGRRGLSQAYLCLTSLTRKFGIGGTNILLQT
jgi:hypothetical protein